MHTYLTNLLRFVDARRSFAYARLHKAHAETWEQPILTPSRSDDVCGTMVLNVEHFMINLISARINFARININSFLATTPHQSSYITVQMATWLSYQQHTYAYRDVVRQFTDNIILSVFKKII